MEKIPYKLTRSRRRTLGLELRPEGLVGRSPFRTTNRQIEYFVVQHREELEWVEAICRKNDLLVFYDEIHSEIADVEPHGHNPILANTIKRIGLAERTGREINQIYEGSLLYGWRLPDYLQSTDSSVRPFMLRGLPDKAFVRMISEDIGHSAARLCPRGLPAPTSPVGRGKARPAW